MNNKKWYGFNMIWLFSMGERKEVSPSEIVINENELLAPNRRGAMTVYFADAGEKLWDVARKYLADITEMKRINGIEDEKLTGGQMILIPVN